jgi:hypothetical protein
MGLFLYGFNRLDRKNSLSPHKDVLSRLGKKKKKKKAHFQTISIFPYLLNQKSCIIQTYRTRHLLPNDMLNYYLSDKNR